MFNLFDILQAQSGPNMQALGQPFGLSPEQSRRAVEALLPALTLGLQRNATDPVGLGNLFGILNPQSTARPPQPDLLLGQLFGSPALSQAVLQQAAASSGIGAQALRQMLPLMAGMVVAGIVHVMLNQPPPAAYGRAPPKPEPSAFPAVDFWKDWMDNFAATTGATGPDRQDRPAGPPAEARRPPPETGGNAQADGDASMQVLQQMFETGAQVQEQNVRAMQDLFDTFWKRAPGETPSPADATENAGPPRAKPADRSN